MENNMKDNAGSILKRDVDKLKQLNDIIGAPSQILKMDGKSVQAVLQECLARLRTVRMGGRSTSLACLSIVLWQIKPANQKEMIESLGSVNVEALLALAFQLACDPSYIQPEWGVVLAGVLIAKYSRQMPRGSKSEAMQQCHVLLQHLKKCAKSSSVRHAAAALLQAWKNNFRDGLDSVIQNGYRQWPKTDDCSSISQRELDKQIRKLLKVLPEAMNERQRKLYRLFLERKGSRQLLQSVSLC
jgi:hypothetical protein